MEREDHMKQLLASSKEKNNNSLGFTKREWYSSLWQDNRESKGRSISFLMLNLKEEAKLKDLDETHYLFGRGGRRGWSKKRDTKKSFTRMKKNAVAVLVLSYSLPTASSDFLSALNPCCTHTSSFLSSLHVLSSCPWRPKVVMFAFPRISFSSRRKEMHRKIAQKRQERSNILTLVMLLHVFIPPSSASTSSSPLVSYHQKEKCRRRRWKTQTPGNCFGNFSFLWQTSYHGELRKMMMMVSPKKFEFSTKQK